MSSYPQITKDGVTVAKNIKFLRNKLQSVGSKLLLDASQKANDETGDGTTTCSVIANSILQNGYKVIQAGVNPIEIRKGIQKGLDYICDHLTN